LFLIIFKDGKDRKDLWLESDEPESIFDSIDLVLRDFSAAVSIVHFCEFFLIVLFRNGLTVIKFKSDLVW